MNKTPRSCVSDLYVEVFFESDPHQIHRPDLKATLNHFAFLQASVVIRSHRSSCSVSSHRGFSAPPSGYCVGLKDEKAKNQPFLILSAADQRRLWERFLNPFSGTAGLQPDEDVEECW